MPCFLIASGFCCIFNGLVKLEWRRREPGLILSAALTLSHRRVRLSQTQVHRHAKKYWAARAQKRGTQLISM